MVTLKESFENAFKNLGVVPTPLKCFQKWFGQMKLDMKEEGVGGFIKKGIGVSL
jgi:hypothetical protein